MGSEQTAQQTDPPPLPPPAAPPPPNAPPATWAAFWQSFGLVVGPIVIEPKPAGGWLKRSPTTWRRGHLGAWYCAGAAAPLERWRRDWPAVGVHLGRSRLVCLDIDSPEGHPTKGLQPLEVQCAAVSAMIGAAAFERPALLWRTASGGFCLAWYLPADVEPPPGCNITVPGLPHTIELRSGEGLAVVPSGTSAPGLPAWQLILPPLPPDAAPLLPAALWAALTSGAAAAALEPGEPRRDADSAAPALPGASVLPGADVHRLETIARLIGGRWQWAGDGRSIRAACPCCARRGRRGLRLKLAIDAAGAVTRHCWRGCTLEDIDAAAARPLPRSLLYDRPRLDVRTAEDPALAAALGRTLAAFETALSSSIAGEPDGKRRAALRRQGETERRIMRGIVQAAAAAGSLRFELADATLSVVAAVHVDTLRQRRAGRGGALSRVLSRYPGLVRCRRRGGFRLDGSRSSVYELTPPAEGAPEALPPVLLPGGNAARGLAVTAAARSGAWRTLEALTGPKTRRQLAAELGAGGPSPDTVGRHFAALEAAGHACRVQPPPGPRGRGKPAPYYDRTPAGAAALERKDNRDSAAAALLPPGRRSRGDAAALDITMRRRAMDVAFGRGGLEAVKALAKERAADRAAAKERGRKVAQQQNAARPALAAGGLEVEPAAGVELPGAVAAAGSA